MKQKIKDVQAEKKVVTLPEGKFARVCCADCRYGNWDSGRRQVWCGKYRKWFDGSDSCSNGES